MKEAFLMVPETSPCSPECSQQQGWVRNMSLTQGLLPVLPAALPRPLDHTHLQEVPSRSVSSGWHGLPFAVTPFSSPEALISMTPSSEHLVSVLKGVTLMPTSQDFLN